MATKKKTTPAPKKVAIPEVTLAQAEYIAHKAIEHVNNGTEFGPLCDEGKTEARAAVFSALNIVDPNAVDGIFIDLYVKKGGEFVLVKEEVELKDYDNRSIRFPHQLHDANTDGLGNLLDKELRSHLQK